MKPYQISFKSSVLFNLIQIGTYIVNYAKGPFTNYVYKRRGVGGQKKPNHVNVVCERPLIIEPKNKKFELLKNMFA